MRYRKLGSSSLEISVVSLGTWVFGGDQWGETDDKESIAAIQKAIDSGINLIDTAPVYGSGHSEEVVGKAIKGRRNQVFIATKCGLQRKGKTYKRSLKPSQIRKDLEGSLSRLKVERIDLYQCHWPDPNTPIEETLEEMVKMQSEGKISYIGVSNFDLPLLEKAIKVAPIVSIQAQFSLLERSIERDIFPFCREKGIGVMTYGSLASGILSGKYEKQPTFKKTDARYFFYPFYREPYWSLSRTLISEIKKIAQENGKPVAQVAINWVIHQPGVTTAIVGARTPEQVEINAGSGDWELSEDDLKRIRKIIEATQKSDLTSDNQE
jgi:aryl-alcohol dehydrogenase-like predicted oxidoreductase